MKRKKGLPTKKSERIRFGFRSLSVRYSIFFILAVMLIFLVSFIYTLIYTTEILVNEADNDTSTLMELTIARLENTLQEVEQVPNVLARFVGTADPDYAEIRRVLQGIVLSEPYVYGTCMAFEPYAFLRDSLYYAIYSYQDHRGIKTRFLGGNSYNYFEKEWYKKVKETGKPVWTEPYYDEGAGDTLMCTYSVPLFRDRNGKHIFVGVITLDLSLSSIGEAISRVKIYETGYAFLISGNGAILTNPDSTLINKNIFVLAEDTVKPVFKSLVRRIQDSTDMSNLVIMGKKNTTTKVEKLSSTGWYLVLVFPPLELFSDLIDFLKYLGTIFLFSVLAVFIVTILITRRLTNPLRKLVKATHQIGQGDFNLELPRMKRRDEIGVLSRSFSIMLDQLKEHIHTLEHTIAEKEKIESELSIAHTIQMGMLPREFPLRSEFELFAILDSARAVGGDLYDFYFLDQDHLFISVGDVSGKGVPASLFMTVVRTLYRSRTMDGQPLHLIMSHINDELRKDNPNVMFVTMISGIINLKTGETELCNAGHNLPLIMDREGNVKRISLFPAIPLGINEYHDYRIEKIQLQPGDRLVLYTDGVTDAISPNGELFGEPRLKETLNKYTMADVPGLVKEVVKSIYHFSEGEEQADDITLLILGYQKSSLRQDSPDEIKLVKVRNKLEELHTIVATMDSIAEEWNISSKAVMELNLVLEELFTNIVFYAFTDKGEHIIEMTFHLFPSGILEILIMDDGRYFDLLQASPEVNTDAALEDRKIGGLGIHFVRQMTDEMLYERKGGRNIVTIKKKIR